jgi:hypothetical protein
MSNVIEFSTKLVSDCCCVINWLRVTNDLTYTMLKMFEEHKCEVSDEE